MILHYNWFDTTLLYHTQFNEPSHSPKMRQYFNEIWGWHNPADNREYAIIGVHAGVYIFDVTNIDSCYMADFILAKDIADVHRDYKTHSHYLYAVADEGNNSLQIIDLSTLPDSASLVYDSDEFVRQSHNIQIADGVLYMVSPKTPDGRISGFRMLDIDTNPEVPTLIADFELPSGQGVEVHDMYVRDNIAYCSNGNSGLFFYNISNPNNITTVNQITVYSEQGYNHNSWLSEDGNTLYFSDETHGMGIKSYDITDFNNIYQNAIFRSNVGAIPHNHFVKGDSLYVGYYHDGVYVFNIEDPSCPYPVAYYDTYDENFGYHSFQGAWGVYPYLPSGTILASDLQNGLFVFTLEEITSVTPPLCFSSNISESKLSEIQIYPNPATNKLIIKTTQAIKGLMKIYNSKGELVYQQHHTSQSTVDISTFSEGIYMLYLVTAKEAISKPFVKN